MKNGPAIPGWAAGVGIAAVVAALLFFGVRAMNADGPLPESKYPKEAFLPPSYGQPNGKPYTKDGKPVNGPGGAPASSGSGGTGPYGGAYGQRP